MVRYIGGSGLTKRVQNIRICFIPYWKLKMCQKNAFLRCLNPKGVLRQFYIPLGGSHGESLLSVDCTPAAEIFQKLSPHLRKWERCDLGGKHRARYCHLLLVPPFRLTPNEAKGVGP